MNPLTGGVGGGWVVEGASVTTGASVMAGVGGGGASVVGASVTGALIRVITSYFSNQYG